MQLVHAIDAWVATHGAHLSESTLQDIRSIRSSVQAAGWGELPCDEVDEGIRMDVVHEARDNTALAPAAIQEFMSVLLAWESAQDTDDGEDDDESDEDWDDDDDDEDWDDDDESDEDWDDDDESDEDDDDDESDEDWDDDDESDEEDDDDDDEDWDDDDDDDDDDEDYDDDDESDEDDDDDDEDWDDDEIEEDDDESDEGELDDDDSDEVVLGTDDEWMDYLATDQDGDGFEKLPPENEPAPVKDPEKAAATSFFDALGATPEPPVLLDDEVVIEPDVETPSGSGVFSAAAETIPRKPASGIDWITVAYFSVAVICFGLVIYFYLQS